MVALFGSHQRVTYGGLLIIHALIVVNEKQIDTFIETIGPYLASCIDNPDDENCTRFACGLISDLSNYLEREMYKYAAEFMRVLNRVLSTGDYATETKLHAMIAVGDMCLAIEENFQQYLEETMRCLFTACQITLSPP